MVTVTLSPAAAPVAVPLMICAWRVQPLITSSPATVLMVTAAR
jgi:hypothetical protein